MLLHEHQNNDSEKRLGLFSICPVRLSNLAWFKRPFLPVDIGDFLQKVSFKTYKNERRDEKIFPCFHVLFSLGRMETPKYVNHNSGKTFSFPEGASTC